MTPTRLRRSAVGLIAAALLATAACGNSSNKSGAGTPTTAAESGGTVATTAPVDLSIHHPVTETGVTDTTIRVGSVASLTNPTGMATPSFNRGIKAYFAMVDRKGGIWGRQLQLVSERDDQLGNNQQEVQGLISNDNVFAAMIATVLFTGAKELGQSGIPSFGWNINADWAGPQNFFPNLGALCFSCVGRQAAWLASKIHKHTLGILAYTVAQSKVCADGMKLAATKYGRRVGLKLGFYDASLSFGVQDLSPQVDALRKHHVDFVVTCMDNNAVFTVKQEMARQNYHPVMLHPNLYDQAFVKKYAKYFEGDYVVPQFLALERTPRIPAVQALLAEARRDHQQVDELYVEGWIAAKQLYDALRATGPDFTRAKLVQAWNSQPRPYTADGWLAPIAWPKQHTDFETDPSAAPVRQCFNWVKVHAGGFVPVFGTNAKPWVCYSGKNQNDLTPEYMNFVVPPPRQ